MWVSGLDRGKVSILFILIWISFKTQMACIIFPLIRASEISLGIWITPPFRALCKEKWWKNFAGGGWVQSCREERQGNKEKRFRGQKARELDYQLETKQILKSVRFQKRKEWGEEGGHLEFTQHLPYAVGFRNTLSPPCTYERGGFYHPDFSSEETEAQKLGNSFKVIQQGVSWFQTCAAGTTAHFPWKPTCAQDPSKGPFPE